MFSTIVVGTDGSKDAERALQAGAELAGMHPGAEVHVVSAFHPLGPAELRDMAEQLPQEFRPLVHGLVTVEAPIAEAKRIMSRAGVSARYHEVDGDPTDALLECVENVDADLLIVGSRGEGAAKRLLHGSVSTKVLHHAPCSVLVVKVDS